MSENMSELERLTMQLSFKMDDEGGPLTPAGEAELVARIHQLDGEEKADDGLVGGLDERLAAIEAQLNGLKSGASNAKAAPAPTTVTIEDVLAAIDPRDSDAALALYGWLQENGRFGVLGTLNGGGYLLHYQEPKGTTKAGYTPGGTKGGRLVDDALDAAKQSGAKPRKTGICDQCMSSVLRLDDGSVVLDDESLDPVCSAAGAQGSSAHNFVE